MTNAYVHKHHPLISQNFVHISTPPEVADVSLTSPQRMNVLLHYLLHPSTSSSSITHITEDDLTDLSPPVITSATDPPVPTMLFANSSERVAELAAALRRYNVRCVEYHKLIHSNKKQEALDQFRNGEVKLLLCTDAAARFVYFVT